jgi:hypothetical protein
MIPDSFWTFDSVVDHIITPLKPNSLTSWIARVIHRSAECNNHQLHSKHRRFYFSSIFIQDSWSVRVHPQQTFLTWSAILLPSLAQLCPLQMNRKTRLGIPTWPVRINWSEWQPIGYISNEYKPPQVSHQNEEQRIGLIPCWSRLEDMNLLSHHWDY